MTTFKWEAEVAAALAGGASMTATQIRMEVLGPGPNSGYTSLHAAVRRMAAAGRLVREPNEDRDSRRGHNVWRYRLPDRAPAPRTRSDAARLRAANERLRAFLRTVDLMPDERAAADRLLEETQC